jgi:hypothetical protein
LEEMRSSGLGVKPYCRSVGLSPATVYQWLSRGKERGRVTFARAIRVSEKASIVVEVAGARLRVEPGFDGELLRAVVCALSEKGAK